MMTMRFAGVALCLATMVLGSACGGAIDTTDGPAAASESSPALPVRGPGADEAPAPAPAPASAPAAPTKNVDPIDPFRTDVPLQRGADAGAGGAADPGPVID